MPGADYLKRISVRKEFLVGQTTVTNAELHDNKKLAPDNASREQTPDVQKKV